MSERTYKQVRVTDIAACPHHILQAAHYRQDGTCTCVPPKAPENAVCVWQEDTDGAWQTDCGKCFCLEDDTPKGNDMKFCCYCGHPLEQRLYPPPEEDEDD